MPTALPFLAFAALVCTVSPAGAGNSPHSPCNRIDINLGAQTLTYYRGASAVLQTGISTGKRGFETPTGNYSVSDKCLNRRSSIYHVQMPFFLRLSGSPYGIHYGYNPGYAASHGCIRVATAQAAEELYDLVGIGTPVKIRPGSRFGLIATPPVTKTVPPSAPKSRPFWKCLFPGPTRR
ncbi:MAG TPA: L,D-transpeptidase [Chthoniobacterales bacterium]